MRRVYSYMRTCVCACIRVCSCSCVYTTWVCVCTCVCGQGGGRAGGSAAKGDKRASANENNKANPNLGELTCQRLHPDLVRQGGASGQHGEGYATMVPEADRMAAAGSKQERKLGRLGTIAARQHGSLPVPQTTFTGRHPPPRAALGCYDEPQARSSLVCNP